MTFSIELKRVRVIRHTGLTAVLPEGPGSGSMDYGRSVSLRSVASLPSPENFRSRYRMLKDQGIKSIPTHLSAERQSSRSEPGRGLGRTCALIDEDLYTHRCANISARDPIRSEAACGAGAI